MRRATKAFTLAGAALALAVTGAAGVATAATTTPTAATPTTTAPSVGTPAAGAPTASTGTTVNVSTAKELTAALKAVKPGETIQLAAGTYSGAFAGTVAGTSTAPITLTGPKTAILTNPNTSGVIGTGYGFHLEVSYWVLSGFSVDNSAKGIVLDHSNHSTVNGLTVYNIGDEGIHLREFSSYDIVEHSDVHDTGKKVAGYGEGIYVGSSQSNWCTYTNCKPDLCNYDKILDNTEGPNVAAENVDVKEATVGGTISGNAFNGAGESGANFSTDVVSVKGNHYTVSNNTVINADIQDAFMAEQLYGNSGCGNTFKQNKVTMHASGYGFNIKDQSSCGSVKNVVGASNTVTGAGKGASSIPETPGV